MSSLFNRAAAYFFLVFAAGFVLGLIRVPFLVPRFGELLAELIEAPIMLTAIFLAAKHVVRSYPAKHRVEHWYSGLLALGFMLLTEVTVVLALQKLTLSDYLSARDPVAGSVYIVMLLIFAAMPWLVSNPKQ